MVSTWLGMITTVQSQSVRRDSKPMTTETTAAIGRPSVQYCTLSQASRRPLSARIPSSSETPVTKAIRTIVRVPSTTVVSARQRES
jgi:hypothetical protein